MSEHYYCYLLTRDSPAAQGDHTWWYHYHVKEGALARLADTPEGNPEGEGARVYFSLEECYRQGWVALGDREWRP